MSLSQKDSIAIFDVFMQNVTRDFRSSPDSLVLREEVHTAEEQCRKTLSEEQQKRLSQYSDRLAALGDNYAEFCYRRGVQDCIALLKRLRIL